MMHHREKKKNNIYISSGAFWCIGALRCIWCICTIMPLDAFSQDLSSPTTDTQHISKSTKSDAVWMLNTNTKAAFKTRLHNDLITAEIDLITLQQSSAISIHYAHDITIDSLVKIAEVPAKTTINFNVNMDGHYIIYGTSKEKRDTILAIYQVTTSQVHVYQKTKI